VNYQQDHRLPHLQGAGDEEVTPAERDQDEQQHAALDDAARIEAVAERPGDDRKQEERQPVRNDREPAQRRGMEFLKHHPVADDVLDIVGHHRNHKADELRAKARVAHRSERLLRGRWRRCGILGLDVQGRTLSGWRQQPDGCGTR
jgi:hypothetical protein